MHLFISEQNPKKKVSPISVNECLYNIGRKLQIWISDNQVYRTQCGR